MYHYKLVSKRSCIVKQKTWFVVVCHFDTICIIANMKKTAHVYPLTGYIITCVSLGKKYATMGYLLILHLSICCVG